MRIPVCRVIDEIENKLEMSGASNADVSQYLNTIKKDADYDRALATAIRIHRPPSFWDIFSTPAMKDRDTVYRPMK